jgi:hypothetical protein
MEIYVFEVFLSAATYQKTCHHGPKKPLLTRCAYFCIYLLNLAAPFFNFLCGNYQYMYGVSTNFCNYCFYIFGIVPSVKHTELVHFMYFVYVSNLVFVSKMRSVLFAYFCCFSLVVYNIRYLYKSWGLYSSLPVLGFRCLYWD